MLRVVAQSLGIEDLKDECIADLLPEVELRVREIIQDALKFKNHSKKTHLTTQHVNQALQTRNLEVSQAIFSDHRVKDYRNDLFYVYKTSVCMVLMLQEVSNFVNVMKNVIYILWKKKKWI
jgi:hypothetical protein